MKNTTLDNNTISNLNGNFTTNISELKRELRCNECKRLLCLGNCAPGQEYRQYRRSIPFSSLPNTREQIRCKLNLRAQRSTTDLCPRSTQQNVHKKNYLMDFCPKNHFVYNEKNN
jgi:hypothetical protein